MYGGNIKSIVLVFHHSKIKDWQRAGIHIGCYDDLLMIQRVVNKVTDKFDESFQYFLIEPILIGYGLIPWQLQAAS